MSKNGKKDVLGASPDNGSTVESAPVAIPSKGRKDSPLAEYQWEPGESGNPKGRPKTSDLKAEVRQFADEQDPKLRKTRLRQWLEMADRRARQGSPKHLELLLAYGWGRPSQAVELEANLNYTDALTSMRAKRLAEADQTIRQYFLTPGLAAVSPTNGHSDPETAQAAASMPEQDVTAAREDDTERPAQPAVEQGPVKRVVTRAGE
ncbi:MAG: DUF5681 domain-containing protein [Candidatus Acidiferrales bacterium]